MSQTVVRRVTCESCGVPYLYDDKVEVKETLSGGRGAEARARRAAESELNRLINADAKIVPCPQCKAQTRDMRRDHLPIRVYLLVFIVVCLLAWLFGLYKDRIGYLGDQAAARLRLAPSPGGA